MILEIFKPELPSLLYPMRVGGDSAVPLLLDASLVEDMILSTVNFQLLVPDACV